VKFSRSTRRLEKNTSTYQKYLGLFEMYLDLLQNYLDLSENCLDSFGASVAFSLMYNPSLQICASLYLAKKFFQVFLYAVLRII
jgi:hypothetical protein